MPGIVGMFDAPAQRPQGRAPFDLARADGLGWTALHNRPGALLGVLERPRPPAAGSVHEREGTITVLYGHCLDPRGRGALDAAAAADLLEREGEGVLDRLEGGFHLVRLDTAANRLTLMNDRLASLPCYWHRRPGLFCFGPQIRNLPPAAAAGPLDPTAALFFLSIGHYVGDRTLLRDVELLAPASILELDLTDLTVRTRRYWTLVYEPDAGARPRDLARALGEAILEATELMTAPAAGRGGIFLSGGWDSRGILGASLQLDRPPALVVANGKSDTIPGSDTAMSRRLADDLGLDYRFCRREPQPGPELWLDGIRRCELATDNSPENYGQHRLPAETFGDIAYILKGDVTWGSGDRAWNREQSLGKCVPYPLGENVKAVLAGDLAGRADALYEAALEEALAGCRNTDWTDRRDYLWQMSSINRYILGLGYADEWHVQVRRPLLSGIVLRTYLRVPAPLRVQKNLFRQTLALYFPRLYAYGRNHVSNIANYWHFLAPFARERALAHLDAGNDLDGLLDREAVAKRLRRFQPRLDPDRRLRWRRRLYYRLHDRYSHLWHRTRWYREKPVKLFRTSDDALAYRLYLLLEWYHGQRA